MKINVKILNGAECNPNVSEDMLVSQLKSLIMNEMKVPTEKQRLMFKGKPLKDKMMLRDCGVIENSKLILSVKELSGGESIVQTSQKSSAKIPAKSPLHQRLVFILQKYYSSSTAESIADEFMKDLHSQIQGLSLDDIERIAKANLNK